MIAKIKKLGKRHLQNNFLLYFILFLSFILGIIIGSILINRLEQGEHKNISNYFSWIFQSISNSNKPAEIFKVSFISNLKIALIMWVLGFFFIGIIIMPFIIGWKGMAIGFTVGFLVKEFGIRGFGFSIISLLPHYLIILPCFLIIGAISSSNAIFRKKNKGKFTYKRDFLEHTIIVAIFFITITIGSLMEGFFIPFILKILGLNI